VPGDPFAPQGARAAVPVGEQGVQVGAGRRGGQRAYHHAGGLELAFHPLDPDRGVLAGDVGGGHDLVAGQLAGRLQPPQRQQLAVLLVEPAGRLGGLPALAGQLQPGDRQIGEVRARITDVVGQQRVGRAAPGPVPLAHLPDRDRDQPGPEGRRLAQVAEVAQHPEHDVLHHVVHVGVPVQGAADDRVDQRQVPGDEPVDRGRITVAGGHHRGGVGLLLHVLTSPWRIRSSLVVAGFATTG
jgi:hypothetical protein